MIDDSIQIIPWWENNNSGPLNLNNLTQNMNVLQLYFFRLKLISQGDSYTLEGTYDTEGSAAD